MVALKNTVELALDRELEGPQRGRKLGVTDLTALGGTLLLPFVAIASPLAGMVIDRTGSYPAVFLMGATIASIALFGFAFLVREPRTGRLYVLKQIAMR